MERLEISRERNPELEIRRLSETDRAPFRRANLEGREEFVRRVGASGQAVLKALLAAIRRAEDRRHSDE